jgi:multidrug efflux system membrane fusion protein
MRISRLALGGAVALLVAGVVAYAVQQGAWHLGGGPAGAAPDPAAAGGGAAFAMPVPVTKVVRRTVPVHLEYAARAEAIRQITLQAKISGFLMEQAVPDGAEVAAGDLLYRIDPRDYEAALDMAKAQVQREAASLDYVRSNLGRGNELNRTGYLSKDTFDQRTSAVRQAEAALAMGEAAARTAELNLGRTEIRAPFPGRLGRNQAPVGTLVSAGSTVLNTLVQLAPLYVTFNPSETDVAAIQQARAKGLVSVDVLLPGGAGAPQAGEFTFVDNVIDRSTGTTTMRATVAEPGPDAPARPVRARPPEGPRGGRRPDGAAGRGGLEPARQVRLPGRRGRQGRAAARAARPRRRRPRGGPGRRRRRRATSSSAATCRRSARERPSSRSRALPRAEAMPLGRGMARGRS